MIARRVRPVSPAFWLLAPMCAALAASLIFAVPLRISGIQLPEPVFALVPAFAWAIVRPSIFAPVALLVLGLVLDLLWGDPPGLWAICLLIAYAVIFAGRRILAGQEFVPLWAAYAAACGTAMLAGLALTFLRAGHAPSLIGVGLQFSATAALFPFAWKLLERYEARDTRY